MTAQWGESCEKLMKDGESLSESSVTGATYEVPIHRLAEETKRKNQKFVQTA